VRIPLSLAALGLLGSLGVILAAGPASAVQIFVCQPGPGQPCTSAPGGTAIGGESNLITTPGAFDIGVAGNFTLQSPLLVGVALPNGVGSASISFGAVTNEPIATGHLRRSSRRSRPDPPAAQERVNKIDSLSPSIPGMVRYLPVVSKESGSAGQLLSPRLAGVGLLLE
jgi:hypothetical protein